MRPHSFIIPVKLSARIFVRTVIICTVVMYGKEGTNICPTFDRRLTLLLFRSKFIFPTTIFRTNNSFIIVLIP